MRKLIICFIFFVSLSSSVFAWANEYEITIDPYGPSLGGSMEIEMRKKYDYDPLNRYRGEIESDGSVRMRNMYGDVLRGTIDSDGYGTLHNMHGNIYRVRPR
jgi:hypothetical protein